MKIKGSHVITAAAGLALICGTEAAAVYLGLDSLAAGIILTALCLITFFSVRPNSFDIAENSALVLPGRGCLAALALGFAAVTAVMIFADNFTVPGYGKIQPYFYIRLAVIALAFISAVLFAVSAFISAKALNSALIFAAIFCFAALAAESAYCMPLPDLEIYLPQFAAPLGAGLFFCNLCMAGRSQRQYELTLLARGALAGSVFCFSEVAFYFIKGPAAYLKMAFYTPLYSLLAGCLMLFFFITLGRRIHTVQPPVTEENDEVQC